MQARIYSLRDRHDRSPCISSINSSQVCGYCISSFPGRSSAAHQIIHDCAAILHRRHHQYRISGPLSSRLPVDLPHDRQAKVVEMPSRWIMSVRPGITLTLENTAVLWMGEALRTYAAEDMRRTRERISVIGVISTAQSCYVKLTNIS